MYDMYVGTNFVRGSKGIYHVSLDENTGELTCLGTTAYYNAGYLLRTADKSRLYTVSEGMTFCGMACGGVVAYDLSSGAPQEINSMPSYGQRPCHLSIDPQERALYVGNFYGGTIACFPLGDGGALEPVRWVFRHERTQQFRTGIHCVQPHPTGAWLGAIELSRDAVNIYDIRLDCRLTYTVEMPKGFFPRHLVFSGDGRYLYLLSQGRSEIHVFAFEPEHREQLRRIQVISTIPEGFCGKNEPAAIRFHPTGNLLAISNRGVGEGERLDSIALFRQDEESGLLTLLQIAPTQGRTPRDIAFIGDGSWLVAALQSSNALESFRVDPDAGKIWASQAGLSIPSPACVAV